MLSFAPLWGAVLVISFVLTMVGLGGGLLFSPLFLMLGMPKAVAASTSLFLNLVAASSAAGTYGKKKMVDYPLSVPLIISSSLSAPLGSYVNGLVDVQSFSILMAVILILAAIRMAFVPKKDTSDREQSAKAKVVGGLIIGLAIGFLGGFLGIGGGVFDIQKQKTHFQTNNRESLCPIRKKWLGSARPCRSPAGSRFWKF